LFSIPVHRVDITFGHGRMLEVYDFEMRGGGQHAQKSALIVDSADADARFSECDVFVVNFSFKPHPLYPFL
jgi:hypothetical protein